MGDPLRIVADENIPAEVVSVLRDQGCNVYWIAAEKPGIPDADVWNIAASKRAMLLTRDTGFPPQLTKDEILHGPPVLVFKASGVQDDELRFSEVFAQLLSWYFRECGNKDWYYVTTALEGRHRIPKQCWGAEQRRRKKQ